MLDNQIISYQHSWILDEVYKASDRLQSRITNTVAFEARLMNKIGKYITQDQRNIKNKRYIILMIHREIADALIRRTRKEYAIKFSEVSFNDEEGQSIEYEPVDVLANVEHGLEIKETITLLAKDDRRRNLILNAWANGNTNDTELSDTLASVLGGQPRTHCKFIQRFRIECRGVLTATAI